jgi:hypothetical protein
MPLLRQDRVGEVVDLVDRQVVGPHRIDQHRRHRLAGGNAAQDDRDAGLGAAELDGPPLGGAVGLHNIGEVAARALHHRPLRHGGDAPAVGEHQADVDELSRPQSLVGVREGRLESERAGRDVDLVIDHRDLAARQLDLGIVAQRDDGERARRLPLAHLVVDVLRHREIDEDRLDLRDADEAGRLGRLDEVADIDQARAGAAIERRADVGIIEIEPGVGDRRVVGGDRAFQRAHDRRLLVEALARLITLLAERAVAPEVEFPAAARPASRRRPR